MKHPPMPVLFTDKGGDATILISPPDSSTGTQCLTIWQFDRGLSSLLNNGCRIDFIIVSPEKCMVCTWGEVTSIDLFRLID